MKCVGKRVLSGILALMMISSLLCTAASATVKSSAYLDAYRAVLTPDPGGVMTVTVQVTGVGYMPKLGAKEVHLYESTNGRDFHWIASYGSDDEPFMLGSGTVFYEDVLTFTGTPGHYYYATACVYAGNSNGGDERYVDSAIKQAKA